MFKKYLLLLLSFCVFATPALADDLNPQDSSSLDQCLKKAGGVMHRMRECEAKETKRLDAILNASYKKILNSRMDAQDKETVKTLQRNWLSHRDKTMNILRKYAGGGRLALLELDGSFREILQNQTIILWRLSQNLK